MSKKLNLKQRKFVDGLFEGKTQINAYKDAGYSPKDDHVASAGAYQLLENIGVQEEIARRLEVIERANRIRLGRIGQRAVEELYNMVDKPEIDGIKLSAVKDALDRVGLKPIEKVEHGGTESRPVAFKFVGVTMEKILAMRKDK